MDDKRIENEEKTTQALAKAKEALISFALTYQYTSTTDATPVPKAGLMGFLPCPEGATEGSSAGTCGAQYQSAMGRLPWKTLGIDPLKDGSGSCLWYVISSEYKNSGGLDRALLGTANGLARTEMLNDDSNGSFILEDRAGNVIKGAAPSDRVVAIIIAPGKPVTGQVRTNDNSQCGGDNDATHFMEVFNGVVNTTVTANDDVIDTFVAADKSNDDVFNDRIITITQQEVFDAIKKRSDFNTLINTTTQALAQCVAEFGLQNAPVAGGGVPCRPTCNQCRQTCQDDWQDCRDLASNFVERFLCFLARQTCRNNCVAPTCGAPIPGCGGGGGGNDYRLPWPAAIDVGGFDYRFSESYIEDDVSGNHLGRLPVDVRSTAAITTNPGSDYLLEKNYGACTNFNTDVLTNGTDNYNSPERRIWENWKDHFFYALGNDFDVNAATPTPDPCVNCLSINGAGNYAAIVMFLGERLNFQSRNTAPDADEKNNIINYLEGSNAVDDGAFQTGAVTPAFNDIAYCINADMTVVPCP